MEELILEDIKRIDSIYSIFVKIGMVGHNEQYKCDQHNTMVNFHNELLYRYKSEIPDIEQDLDKGSIDPEYNNPYNRCPNYILNLKLIKYKLQVLLANVRDKKQNQGTVVNTYSTSSSNNNASLELNNSNINTVTNNIHKLFEETKKHIENDKDLEKDKIDEVLKRIEELENIKSSDIELKNKWERLKDTVTWVTNESSKIATEILPLITSMIQ